MADSKNKQWSGKSRGGRFGHQFFVYIIRLLGIRCAYCFLSLIVIYFIPFAPKATKAIWRYHRRVRGVGVAAAVIELYRHYFVFGQTLIDKCAMKSGLASRYNYKFDNYDRFLEMINSGEGVVMIGAHAGCWEAGTSFFGTYGKRINIVMFDAEHRAIKEVVEESAVQHDDFKIVAINRDPIEAMLQIKIALNNGEYVCFNGDRYLDRHSAATVELMHKPALLPTGPFKIALKCRVPIVFYYAMREKRRTYKFIFEMPTIDRSTTVDSLIQQYIESLERLIAKYPRQWFNFYDFWNTNNA